MEVGSAYDVVRELNPDLDAEGNRLPFDTICDFELEEARLWSAIDAAKKRTNAWLTLTQRMSGRTTIYFMPTRGARGQGTIEGEGATRLEALKALCDKVAGLK